MTYYICWYLLSFSDIDTLWQQIESISLEEQEILISQLQDLNLKIISSFDELHLKINSLNWDLLSDYDPPHYRDPITNTESSSFNLSDLLQEQYQLSKVTLYLCSFFFCHYVFIYLSLIEISKRFISWDLSEESDHLLSQWE